MTQRIITRFACKICGDIMEFVAQDPATYIGRSKHETFFGMKLNSFRVSHPMGSEVHYNSIIADQRGLFRGYLDAYAEVKAEGSYAFCDMGTLSDKIRYLFLVNTSSKMVWNFIPSSSINQNVLIEKSMEKVRESSELYTDRSEFRFSVADLVVNCLVAEEVVMLVVPRKESKELLASMKLALDHHAGTVVDNLLNSIALLVKVNDAVPELDPHKIATLVTNPYINAALEIRYPEYIPRIISRLSREFELPESIFQNILRENQTLYSVIEVNPSYYIEILDITEFINRRKLLGGGHQ